MSRIKAKFGHDPAVRRGVPRAVRLRCACGLVSYRVYGPASIALDALSHIALSLSSDGKTQPVNVFLGQGGAGAEIDWSTELAQPGIHQLVLTMKLASDVSEAGLSGKAGQTFKRTVTFAVSAVGPK